MLANLNFGFTRMHAENNERRDFLPDFIAYLEKLGAKLVLETGYGSGMGFTEENYRLAAPSIRFATLEETLQQNYVVVLRCPPRDQLLRLRAGSCLISMLHYPTRPDRVELLRSLGIEAISFDSMKDDSNRRLVENLHSVAWNGVQVAFQTLRPIYPSPGFDSPNRPTLKVTVLGAGAVGVHVMQAAIRYGNLALWQEMAQQGIPGVVVTVVDYDTTWIEPVMREILGKTDILIDATQRKDQSKAVIPNEWVGYLPKHAVLLDLSVDPYECERTPPFTKAIEGIPHGNLDQYIFAPDDPAFDWLPECIHARHRRYTVSCYSWPGIYPKECMQVYGQQLRPIFRTLIAKGGVQGIDPEGKFFERAISRALLSRFITG